MTRRIIASLLIFILPTFLHAADHCTNPMLYNIDRRCYVTDAQKLEKPYNAVVGILNDAGRIKCSGTIVRHNDRLYVFTAKHCVSDFDNVVARTITVVLADGRRVTATQDIVGDYKKRTDENPNGDWARYILSTSNAPYVNKSSQGPYNPLGDARLIGYGTLKILSDFEIEQLKKMYTEGLPFSDVHRMGVTKDGLDVGNFYVQNFINNVLPPEQKNKLFDERTLKVSNCTYRVGGYFGCQSWIGNSGGGIFDSDGNIMAIHTTGYTRFGGKKHAGAVRNINTESVMPAQIWQ